MNKPITIAICLALVIVGCAVLRPTTPAWGGTTDQRGPVLAVTTTVDSNHEMVWLVDTEKHMMCLYDSDRSKAFGIRLVSVRNITWDMNEKVFDYPKSGPAPTAEEMKKMYEETHPPDHAQAPGPGHN